MALLALLAAWPHRPRLAVATVDHGLRPEAAAEARMVADVCGTLGIPHATLTWAGSKPSSGLQNAARDVRYALLAQHARSHGFQDLVTAHHADDQAETVLMRFIAGSGISGLSGMHRKTMKENIQHVRPLLAVAKMRLVATCRARNIPFADDPSNRDDRFGRTRIRSIMNALEGEGLTADRLTRLAARAARADAALDDSTAAVLGAAEVTINEGMVQANWLAVANAPAEIRLRVLARLLAMQAGETAFLKLERLEALLDAIDSAFAGKQRLRRSLADCIVTLQSRGRLTISKAPARQRGMVLEAPKPRV